MVVWSLAHLVYLQYRVSKNAMKIYSFSMLYSSVSVQKVRGSVTLIVLMLILRMNTEDVWGAWINSVNGEIYLSTKGNFAVDGASGVGADIFNLFTQFAGARYRMYVPFFVDWFKKWSYWFQP